MKIILFNSENQVLDIFLAENIEIDGNTISFDGNSLGGVRSNYIIVDNETTDVQIGGTIPEILKEKDKKSQFYKKDPENELQTQLGELQQESAMQLQAIADIYELLMQQGVDPSSLLGGGES
ncbi:hypothetical protein P4661_27625 [Priestia megaterium]|uniref:hypothetical protein n=1 Tax=Priestia megaterium TaxID=1404 RepID=UPI002E238A33|nr:hypothetical protein [Priestia megaterium]